MVYNLFNFNIGNWIFDIHYLNFGKNGMRIPPRKNIY